MLNCTFLLVYSYSLYMFTPCLRAVCVFIAEMTIGPHVSAYIVQFICLLMNLWTCVTQIVSEPAPLWEIPPGCDPLTCEIIRGGLVKEPGERDSARELLEKTTKALHAGQTHLLMPSMSERVKEFIHFCMILLVELILLYWRYICSLFIFFPVFAYFRKCSKGRDHEFIIYFDVLVLHCGL